MAESGAETVICIQERIATFDIKSLNNGGIITELVSFRQGMVAGECYQRIRLFVKCARERERKLQCLGAIIKVTSANSDFASWNKIYRRLVFSYVLEVDGYNHRHKLKSVFISHNYKMQFNTK